MQAQCGLIFDNGELSRSNISQSIADIFNPRPSPGKGRQRTLHDFATLDHIKSESASAGENGLASGSSSRSEVQQTAQSERDVREVEQPIHDELRRKPLWWILELVPTKYTWQRSSSNKWAAEWRYVLSDLQHLSTWI